MAIWWWEPNTIWYLSGNKPLDRAGKVGDVPESPYVPTMRFELGKGEGGDFISWNSSISGDKA